MGDEAVIAPVSNKVGLAPRYAEVKGKKRRRDQMKPIYFFEACLRVFLIDTPRILGKTASFNRTISLIFM